jgi:putative membrane protein
MVDLAGAKDASDGESGIPLIPVAARAEAIRLIYYVTGTSLEDPSYVPAGDKARKLDPLGWSYLGVAMLDRGVVRRRGRWRRSASYVPYARVQSVTAAQGWLQRRFGLATVYLDLPKGAERWKAEHRSLRDAADLVPKLARRARDHREYEHAATAPGDSTD